MKTLYISMISLVCICVIILSSSQAYGIPYISPSAKYFNSDIVLIGKVVSSAPFSSDYTKYQIKVEQYLKNPQSQDILTVVAPGTNTTRMTADTVFDVGQQAFLYLKKDQGNYTVLWYSYQTDSLCDPAPAATDLNFTYSQNVGSNYNPLQIEASKSSSYLYVVNQPVVIKYDAWNNQFTTKTFDVVFQVKNQTGQILFNDTKQVELTPCIGHQIVNSTFIPKVAGAYEVDVIFNNSLTGTTVEIPSSVANIVSNSVYVSPLKQFKSGVAANDVKCEQGLQLVIKAESNSPACVKQQTAQKLVEQGWGWIMQSVDSAKPSLSSRIIGLENDTGIVTLENRTYYFETPHYTQDAYVNPVQISFHSIIFTLFPSGFRGGLPTSCGEAYYWTGAKFLDNTSDLLHIFAGSKCPALPLPTYFSNHTNPQAGLTFYDGKMKLLVSTDNQPSSALQLSLLVNSPYQNPAEPVGIDVYLNNTTSKPLVLTDSSNWPRNDLTSGMCSNLPFGISILDGYYDEQNMTGAKSLLLYGIVPCPFLPQIQSYTFEPFSTKATQDCNTLFSCTGLVDMKKHFDIGDYIDNNNPHQTFKTGTYTIVAGDKWGDISIQHFTEADTIAYDNSSLLSKGN